MPRRSRARLLIALSVGAVVAFTSAQAATAGRGSARQSRGASGAAAAEGPETPTTSLASQPTPSAGNLSVYIPQVPSQHSLPGLCIAYLSSYDEGRNGKAFEVLVGATGGNPASTTVWCTNYLTLWQEGKTGEH